MIATGSDFERPTRRLKAGWLVALVCVLVTAISACSQSAPSETTADESHGHGEQAEVHASTASTRPETRDPNRLWCNEHGLYEDECVICHPELADTATASATADARDPNRLWCNEHGLYEDECVICHPELADTATASAAADARDPNRLWCNEHGVYEDECGICHPELLANPEMGGGLKIRFQSPDSAARAGVRTGYPQPGGVPMRVEVLGELTYNRNKLAMITPFVEGVLREVHVDVGQTVSEGDLLAEIASPEVAEAKSAYIKALSDAELRRQTYQREKGLFEEEIAARKDYESAMAAYQSAQSDVDRAKQHLLNLGLSEAEVAKVAETRSATTALPIRAPFAGTIVERDAVMGTKVEPEKTLFQIADLSTMWLELSVPESQMAGLRLGAVVTVQFEGLPGERFEGELTWVSSQVDPDTRMVEARAVLPNGDRRLKDGMFGRAAVMAGGASAGLTVPKHAVQTIDGTPIIFAKLQDDLYEARIVKLGPAQGGHVSVQTGLYPTDEIALEESYILKSEFLKGRLGAGCVHN